MTNPMIRTLQSPAGQIATFRESKGIVSFRTGYDVIELPITDARKIWYLLLSLQWEMI